MALSVNTPRNKRADSTRYVDDAITDEIYSGAFLSVGGPDHGTAANIGRIYPFNDENGSIPLGFSLTSVTGDLTASPVPEATADIGGGVVSVPVTGLAGDKSDNQTPVFATDDGTFTFTRPTTGIPIGYVINFIDSTDAFVHFYPKVVMDAIAYAGNAQSIIHLGNYTASGLANGDLRTSMPMVSHGEILRLYAIADQPCSGAAAAATINLEIGTTNLTGGVLTLDTTVLNTKGIFASASAITGNNVFHEGDLLSVEASSVTSYATGTFDLYMEVQYKLGT